MSIMTRGSVIFQATFLPVSSDPKLIFLLEITRVDSLPLTVGERDALRRHFEVDGGRSGQRVGRQCLTDGLSDGLRPRERLHVHRVDVENIAR